MTFKPDLATVKIGDDAGGNRQLPIICRRRRARFWHLADVEIALRDVRFRG